MPQPLSTFSKEVQESLSFESYSASHRPQLSAYIVTILSTWCELEAKAGEVFARLMGMELQKGVEIYNTLSLSGLHNLDAIFDSIANVSISQDQRDLLIAVRGLTKTARDQRNTLAHGIWGISLRIQDSLLLMSPKDYLRIGSDMQWKIERAIVDGIKHGKDWPEYEEMFPDQPIEEKIFVYRQNDFLVIMENINTAYHAWRHFYGNYILDSLAV